MLSESLSVLFKLIVTTFRYLFVRLSSNCSMKQLDRILFYAGLVCNAYDIFTIFVAYSLNNHDYFVSQPDTVISNYHSDNLDALSDILRDRLIST